MPAEPDHGRPRFGRGPDGAPSYARGEKWPASALLAVPFLILMALLYPVVKRLVRWRACWMTVLVFGVLMLPVEHLAVTWGLWVYNNNRLLGPTVWGVPIEEPLIYYFFPPIMVAMLYELTAGLIAGQITPRWEPGLKRLARRVPALAPR